VNSTATARERDVTALLRKVSEGDPQAQEQLFEIVYYELRRLARGAMRNERAGHTLQPTALIHEAFIRLVGKDGIEWVDRVHFFAVAARTMRRVLIDHARHGRANKNWGGQRVDLNAALIFTEDKTEAILALDQALAALEAREPRQCKVVELRYFAGLDFEETAAVLGVSAKTVMRDWKIARAWLHAEIEK
jgi:RNA polymerase sigma-70 factor (ECF subfamily)